MQWYRQGILVAILGISSTLALAADWQALPAQAPAPADNPTTPEKVELGRMLFLDPRFSSTGTVSCNSCHNVMLGGEDNRAVSMGVHGKTGGRSAPTVWNSAFAFVPVLGWPRRHAGGPGQGAGGQPYRNGHERRGRGDEPGA